MKYLSSKLALSLLFASLAIGQLLRLPVLGQGGGLLLSDVAVVLTIVVAYMQFLHDQIIGKQKTENRKLVFFPFSFSLFPFILWSLFTLVLRFTSLGSHNFLTAFLYWLRLTSNLLLLPALLILFQNTAVRRFASHVFLLTIATLLAAGFVQFIFFSNLTISGFDPHQGRLFSTWLDPNLFGGFLVIIIPYLLIPSPSPHLRRRDYLSASGERSAPGRVRWHVGVLLAATLIALLLTQSRSSLLALAATSALLLPFIRKAFLVPLSLAFFTLALAVLLFFPQRLLGLFTVDETAQLRLASLSSAWQLAQDHPWLGAGAGAYQFAAQEAGLIQDFSLHSRAGADNSLLTLAVTTGLPGVVLFLIPWLFLAHRLPLSANFSLLALFIHSQFVNSFLYSHLLITLIIIIALCLSIKNRSLSQQLFSQHT